MTAVGSKRAVSLSAVPVPTVLLLVSQETSDSIDPVIAAVREKYPEASQVQIATVVDLRSVPRLLRKVAEGVLNGRYKDAVVDLPEGRDPAEWVIILPDWDGKLLTALNVHDVSKELAIAVIAPGGRLLGLHQGEDARAAALEMLGRA